MLLMLPVAVFLWFVGWGFYWVGSRTKQVRVKPAKTINADELTFTVLEPENKIVT